MANKYDQCALCRHNREQHTRLDGDPRGCAMIPCKCDGFTEAGHHNVMGPPVEANEPMASTRVMIEEMLRQMTPGATDREVARALVKALLDTGTMTNLDNPQPVMYSQTKLVDIIAMQTNPQHQQMNASAFYDQWPELKRYVEIRYARRKVQEAQRELEALEADEVVASLGCRVCSHGRDWHRGISGSCTYQFRNQDSICTCQGYVE